MKIPNLESESHHVKLLRDEKDHIKNRILINVPDKPTVSPYFSPLFYIRSAVVASLILLFVSAPLTYAAQNSVPGDVLYNFETTILEPLQKQFYFSDYEKLTFSVARLEERLNERKELEAEGALTSEQIKELSEVIDRNSADAFTSLADLSPSAETIESALTIAALNEVHVNALEDTTETNQLEIVSTDTLSDLENYLNNYIIENNASLPSLVTTQMNDIEAKLTKLDNQVGADIVSYLEDASEEIAEGDNAEALNALLDAHLELIIDDLEQTD